MPQISCEEVARRFCGNERLTFIKPVGSGSFKETFLVETGSRELLALKVYKPGSSSERSNREIEAMRRCSHDNIAKLYNTTAFEVNDGEYLISLEEFLPGGTLTNRVAERGPLTAMETRQIGQSLINALAHIAVLGLVHRDLKPDNVMFRSDRLTPVIVDFGLVRDLNAISLTQTWLIRGPGTPLFAPAEQLLNQKAMIDWRADQFSLAVSLSIATFGFHPYSEPMDLPPAIVDRVAIRGALSTRFRAAAEQSNLAALITMAEPWPVRRFRTPADLAGAWSAQTERS